VTCVAGFVCLDLFWWLHDFTLTAGATSCNPTTTTMANVSPTPSFALTDTTQKTSLPLTSQATNDGPHREPTAEPLSEADITAMRRRIHEMGILSSENGNAGSRENELANMVGLHQKKITRRIYIVLRFCD
jgi:hypothetical protein